MTTLDDMVVAGSADIRELAFANLELVVAGWGKIAGMLDDRHPLAQAAIGLNMMAEHSLRAISLTPAHVMASSETGGGTAIMKVPSEVKTEVEIDSAQDVRRPWAVAHSNKKHRCIGRSEGCEFSTNGNSIHKHQKACAFAKAIRVREAQAVLAEVESKRSSEQEARVREAQTVLADAAKSGIIDDGSAGKVTKLPKTTKPDGRSMTKHCVGRAAGCTFETKSGRWISRHQAECHYAKGSAPASGEKVKRVTKYCSGRDAGCGFSTKSDRWIARHQNTCGIAKKAQADSGKVVKLHDEKPEKPTTQGKKAKTRTGGAKRKTG